jgi:hypothetical protein
MRYYVMSLPGGAHDKWLEVSGSTEASLAMIGLEMDGWVVKGVIVITDLAVIPYKL